MSTRRRATAVYCALVAVSLSAVIAAALSPLLAWRSPVYIVAGFAGVLGLALLLCQPLLAANQLPGLSHARSRVLHRVCGALLVVLVLAHVIGLWLTSPPDVIDALLFASPTPFSNWGVAAMWALFAAAALGVVRRRWRINPRTWQRVHTLLATVVVIGTVVHALLIEGTMETVTKMALCAVVVVAHTLALWRVWR